jgi:hypothetical protein
VQDAEFSDIGFLGRRRLRTALEAGLVISFELGLQNLLAVDGGDNVGRG